MPPVTKAHPKGSPLFQTGFPFKTRSPRRRDPFKMRPLTSQWPLIDRDSRECPFLSDLAPFLEEEFAQFDYVLHGHSAGRK